MVNMGGKRRRNHRRINWCQKLTLRGEKDDFVTAGVTVTAEPGPSPVRVTVAGPFKAIKAEDWLADGGQI
jgi:hypothetical protein